MKPNLNESSVVVVGLWNRFIFTQEWVFENLADRNEVRMEFPVLDISLPYRYIFADIALIPGSDRIVIIPMSYTKSCFEKANEIAVKILHKLPETPCKAIGFNISYNCDSESKVALDLKSIPQDLFPDTLSGVAVERKFRIDDKTLLNFTVSDADNGFLVKFNYHQELRNKLNPAEITDKFKDCMKKTEGIMEQVYGETIDDTESDSNE